MSQILLKVSLAGLLCLGSYTVFSALADVPAFNAALQEQDLAGRRQAEYAPAMYDYPTYLLHIGTSYTRADMLPPGVTTVDGVSGIAPSSVSMKRAEHATTLLSMSVALDPANAWSWRQLAWGLALSGHADSARAALRRSWALAPYSRQLASARLDLAYVLLGNHLQNEQTSSEEPRQTDWEKAAAARDLETLRMFSRSQYQYQYKRLTDLN